jgi:hypothetical protein|tara:strand:- start:460 stop:693 length:234 start_codon:yes stop_codon:yes gene_type:complete
MERLTLWQRLKPKHKTEIAFEYKGRSFAHDRIKIELQSEYFFTEVKYGIAFDMLCACNMKFLGDMFNDKIFKNENNG